MSGADPRLPRRLMVPILMVMGAFGCRGGNEVVCPATPLLCPAALPIGGTPCSGSTPVGGCEYGDDPWYDCDTIATCDPQSGWIVQATVDGASCPTRLPPECPPTFAIAQAMAANLSCSKLPTYLTCRYPEGTCGCNQGQSALACSPPAPAGCPAVRPRAGAPCGGDAGTCTTWGSGVCDGQSMVCRCGLWQPVFCYD